VGTPVPVVSAAWEAVARVPAAGTPASEVAAQVLVAGTQVPAVAARALRVAHRGPAERRAPLVGAPGQAERVERPERRACSS
jgi:hypothetical protein